MYRDGNRQTTHRTVSLVNGYQMLREGRYEEALTAFEQIKAASTGAIFDESGVWVDVSQASADIPVEVTCAGLMEALVGLGRFDEALEMYSVARAYACGSAELDYLAGLALEGMGDRSRAESLYQSARLLAPQHEEATMALASIRYVARQESGKKARENEAPRVTGRALLEVAFLAYYGHECRCDDFS